ncbi:restriction endonuclease subunit S [Tetragenococcus halophilus]|nr:restriction endonuclease subunit S [Tetragenococcus halophilus]
MKGRLGWKSLKQEEYLPNGPNLIAGKHISKGIIDWKQVDHIPEWRYEESPEIMLQKGDVIFSKDGSLGNPALITNFPGKSTINSTMMLVRTDNTIDSVFFYQVLQSSQFQRLIYLKVSGSSVPHLFQADMNNFSFFAPTIYEQKKVGVLFSKLDTAITLHQRKLEQLREFKRAALQYLFPKKDEAEPKVRFANFSSSWKQRKLGELGKLTSGIGFPNSEQGGNHGVPFFKISDMNNNGNEQEMITANNYVAHEQVYRNNWQPINEVPAIIFAKVGAAISLNRKRLVRYPFLIDNNTMAYSFDDNWSIEFGKAIFETIYLPKYAQIGALPSYNNSDIASVTIHIPDNKEQIHIGHLFNQIEHAIACHQKKLEKLQTLKKAFLQKMFI